MYCSSCFQTAEEGSKFCADCRQKTAESEGADSSLGAISPSEVGTLAVIEDEASIPAAAGGPVDQIFFANPFGGESSGGGWQVPSDPPLVEGENESLPEAPEEIDPEWLSEIVEIQPSIQRGSKEITMMLLGGFLLLSVTTVGQALRPAPLTATPPIVASTSLPIPDVAANAPLIPTSPQGNDPGGSGDFQAQFSAAETSLEKNDFATANKRLIALLGELQAADASAADIRRAELLLAASYLGTNRAEEAYQLARKLAAGDHPQSAMAGQLLAVAEQRLQMKAGEMLNQGVEELRAGRVEKAIQRGRTAQEILDDYGGTPEQKERVEAFLDMAAGLRQGEPQSSLERSSVKSQTTSTRSNTRPPRATIDSAASHPTRSPNSKSGRTAEQGEEPASATSPLSRHVKTGSAPQQERATEPSRPVPSPNTQEPSRSQPMPSGPPPSEERDRAGTQDELPTYRSRTGGTAY